MDDGMIEGLALLGLDERSGLDLTGGRERVLARVLIDRGALDALPKARAAFAERVAASRVGIAARRAPFQPMEVPALGAEQARAICAAFGEPPEALGVVDTLISDVALRRSRPA